MPSHLRFNEDHSDYDPTDSDEDYTENEKILLKNVRNRHSKESDSEGEVFGVGSESEDDDDDNDEGHSDLAASDIEGQDDKDDLPDIRAWGKKKNKYYSTDYVDQDYGGFQGKDAHLAELEEEEARNLQQQLAQQLDDDDFCLDIPTKKEVESEGRKISEEVIKSDISKLSKRQKLEILRKESPEFFGLVEDFELKMTIVRDYLSPVMKKYKKGQIPNTRAVEFVTTQQQLILNYCANIYMYLLLKASRVNVQNHPIIKRLYQYRQLLSQLEPVFEEVVKPQIEILLKEVEEPTATKKTLKLLDKLKEKSTKKKASNNENEQPRKKVKFDNKVTEREVSQEYEEEDEIEPNNEDLEPTKRAITYQMAKNKGLTPHRKKEQRNPRVKHRNKFRKAKIRRRGAVREPRTEMSRYGGEISGIKASVTKGIKLKS